MLLFNLIKKFLPFRVVEISQVGLKQKFEKMLSTNRFFCSELTDCADGRNSFENDYSRIVLSSYVRRMQDKAQVFPLAQNDFVRTRLTHSMEVSCFAKGLGLGVEKFMLSHGLLDEWQQNFIPSILETAGLVHDIGNPPFGHFGEESIRSFFRKLKADKTSKAGKAYQSLSCCQQADFENFDGNVQGFRILKSLAPNQYGNSFNLTFALLATVIKYPFSSTDGNKKTGNPFQKKFGYFCSEQNAYQKITAELGLKSGQRHPLTYLVEAADDIAYSVCDIEDGCKIGLIRLENLKEKFKQTDGETELKRLIDKGYSFDDDKELFVQQFRIVMQRKMIRDVIKTFCDNIENIVNGNFKQDLLSASASASIRKVFKDLGDINFSHKSVLKRELLGDTVITYLLNILTEAVFNHSLGEKRTSKNSKIIALICSKTKDAEILKSPGNIYEKFQKIVDYVSGMTDSFALRMYQEFTGKGGFE